MSGNVRYFWSIIRPRVRDRPTIIWFAPWFLLGRSLLALGIVIIAGVSRSSVIVSGHFIPWPGFMRFLLPAVLGSALLDVAAAYGLWKERLWARPLLTVWAAIATIATMSVAIAAGVPSSQIVFGSWSTWLLIAAQCWYFYGYEPVIAYYNWLRLGAIGNSRSIPVGKRDDR
jgi:hypothetical protein